MGLCCYERFTNTTTTECSSSDNTMSHCLLTFFFYIILFILFWLFVFFRFRHSIKTSKGKIINSSVYALKKGEPDIVSRTCCICQEEIVFKNLITLHCQHYFHQSCLQEWFQHKPVCPICRHDFRVI